MDVGFGIEVIDDDGVGVELKLELVLMFEVVFEVLVVLFELIGIIGLIFFNLFEIESVVKLLVKLYMFGKFLVQDLFVDDEVEIGQQYQMDDMLGYVLEEVDQLGLELDQLQYGIDVGIEDEIFGQDLFVIGNDELIVGDIDLIDLWEVSVVFFEDLDVLEDVVDEDMVLDECEFYQEIVVFDGEVDDDVLFKVEEMFVGYVFDNVILLVMVIFRIVLVDIFGLLCLEWQVFWKIVEVLGVWLEGDLEDWDGGEILMEDVDDLVLVVLEVGLIDFILLDCLLIGIVIVYDWEVFYGNKVFLVLLGY